MDNFRDIFTQSIRSYWLELAASLPKILAGLLLFLVFLLAARFFRRLVRRALSTRMDDSLMGNFLTNVVFWVILIIGVSFSLHAAGLGRIAGGIIAGAGVTAFIIGFAFKDIGENLLAGVLMAFSRPFNVGDTVEINSVVGRVVGLNLRNTHLKTGDGKDVYIPNGSIIKNNLFNYTIDGYMRYDLTVGIDPDDNYRQAMGILVDAVAGVGGILGAPKQPVAMLSGTDSNSMMITVYYWVNTFDSNFSLADLKSEAYGRSIEALSKAGFYLPGNITELKNYRNTLLASG